MPEGTKSIRIDLEESVHRRCKALAAMGGKTLKELATEAFTEKMVRYEKEVLAGEAQ